MTDDLGALLIEHRAKPFPDSIEKGTSHGRADAVMIDADIYGWASRVATGEILGHAERASLEDAALALADSIAEFPLAAHPYYARVLQIARTALSHDS